MRPLSSGLLVSVTLIGLVVGAGAAEARGASGRIGVARSSSSSFASHARATRTSAGFNEQFGGRNAFVRGPGFGPGYGEGPGSIGFGPGYGTSVGFGERYDVRRGKGRFDGAYGGPGNLGYGPGFYSGAFGRRFVPAAAGIRPPPVQPPALHVLGTGPQRVAASRTDSAGRGGPLIASSEDAAGPSGVVGSGPKIIHLR